MIRYPRIIAHRCGGHLAMENTIAGLVAAKQLGCRAVEFDVMLTADGVPILMHDETLDRTTRITGRVADLTFEEIRAGDPRVPTLGEAIGESQRLGLWTNIELKPATGYEEETGSVVCRWLSHNWNGNGVVSSFSQKSALAGRQALPHAAFALLCDTLQDDWMTQSASLSAVAVHLDACRVDAAAAAALAAADVPWAAWTVNDRAIAERVFALGAAAIFTDQPDLIQ